MTTTTAPAAAAADSGGGDDATAGSSSSSSSSGGGGGGNYQSSSSAARVWQALNKGPGMGGAGGGTGTWYRLPDVPAGHGSVQRAEERRRERARQAASASIASLWQQLAEPTPLTDFDSELTPGEVRAVAPRQGLR